MKAVSLFSGAGIGEFYLRNIGIDVILANEIIKSRSIAYRFFYPKCEMINADITSSETQKSIIENCKKNNIKLVIATPPCQGLSSAGSNKTEESLGHDPRNFLVLSALNIIDEVWPDYFIIENVPRFQQMLFPYDDHFISLSELLLQKYSEQYKIDVRIFNAADYGVPQTRYRIVYRAWKKNLTWNFPEETKSITLQTAIGDLPSLEAGECSKIKNHFARVHPENQILCMKHTPTGKSAYENEIFFPKKPDGTKIRGYKNCYKRMKWDCPAPTVTMRNEIISSQENVHPGRLLSNGTWSDARVLTLRELLIVSSLPPDLDIPDTLTETAFRQLIGEGIPPKLMKEIMKGIGNLT